MSTHFGYALSTTQVCTGSVLGSGLGKPGGEVRWGVAGRMATAWLITLPLAGSVGAVTYWIVHLIGGYPGAIIGFSLLVAVSAAIYIRSRRVKVDSKNVNADWEGDLTAGLEGSDQGPPSGGGPKVGTGSPGYGSDDSTISARSPL
jgi:inorganic phosphate transporter, PiT family